jgi:hypothetical protein
MNLAAAQKNIQGILNDFIITAIRDENERQDYGMTAVDTFDFALALAKSYQSKLPNAPFLLHTDDCDSNSPWEFEATSPEEFAFILGVFRLHDDEATFTEAYPEENANELREFALHAKSQMPPAIFDQCVMNHLSAEDKRGNFSRFECIADL